MKALVGAFSVITNLRMDLFQALPVTQLGISAPVRHNLMDGGLTLARKCQRLVKHQQICRILKINILNRNAKYVENLHVLSENGKFKI